jgi:hypothetical protein
VEFHVRLAGVAMVVAGLSTFAVAFAAEGQGKASAEAKADTVDFAGIRYLHRWSKNDQNEYTPDADADLAKWHDMVTIDLQPRVGNGDQLAEVANRVLGNYQKNGKIVRTDSRPRTASRPAEHLIVALFGAPEFVEAAFARCVMVDGVGVVAVYSHRVYGKQAGDAMGAWLQANGPKIEQALMNWDRIPSQSALKRLPQSK